MASKQKRLKARQKRKRRQRAEAPALDIHARQVLDSLGSLTSLIAELASLDDHLAAIDQRLDNALNRLVSELREFEPHRLIEVARLASLPWSPLGSTQPQSAPSAAHIELLALIALSAAEVRTSAEEFPPAHPQAMSAFVSTVPERLNQLLNLAHLRAIARADAEDPLAPVALRLMTTQMLVRHTSYSDLVAETVVALLDGDPDVRAALIEELGFGATEALAVLNCCEELQQAAMNERADRLANAMIEAKAGGGSPPSRMQAALLNLFEPELDEATIELAAIAKATGLDLKQVDAVVDHFQLELASITPSDAVEAFISGANPLRAHPMIVTGQRRVMLPHGSLAVDAVKESLETFLKSTRAWEQYAKHRGDLLEARTTAALQRVLPGALHRSGFKYFIPANDGERDNGDPTRYSKRVEGDHLVVLDDVALIVEDKAVAVSPLSKGGKLNRVRTDLTGIITDAAKQTRRLFEVIRRDGGVRVDGEGWVDLSRVREIHTLVVSLDDLVSVTTATADLVRAGLLSGDNIPWTVSLHDLDLITELVERPSEFLLYLRRRRNPNVTLMFTATDELDLFLYFFEAGLWVEPDPTTLREPFPWLGPPTTSERRRFRSQLPLLITSRTDQLDAWRISKQIAEFPTEPKPKMVESPLAVLVDEIRRRRTFGWLSAGAALLEPATSVQAKMAKIPAQLLDSISAERRGRSQAMPLIPSADPSESWLVVWATRPTTDDAQVSEASIRDYLRTKKYHWGIYRAVAFVYDEECRELVDVYYDGDIGDLPARLTAKLALLHRPEDSRRRLHPNAGSRPKFK